MSALTTTREAARRPLCVSAASLVLRVGVLTLVLWAGLQLVARTFRVEGASMEPTLRAGQLLLVSRAAYLFSGPQRGEVVVVRDPLRPGVDLVKRVIGVPSDTILIADGRVMVNGQPVDESYVRFPAPYRYPASGRPLRVPPNSYFVLGDNRPDSWDSHLGWVVPVEDVVGRVW